MEITSHTLTHPARLSVGVGVYAGAQMSRLFVVYDTKNDPGRVDFYGFIPPSYPRDNVARLSQEVSRT